MAFTGAAVIHYVSDSVVRITGLSLAAGAAGDIGLVGNAGADVAVDQPTWNRYGNARGEQIELDSSIEVTYVGAEAGLAVVEPLSIVKTGNGRADFLATFTNPDAAASGALEIWLKFHGG
jgi:hypothetical protein